MITPRIEIIYADGVAFCSNGQTFASIDEALEQTVGDVKLFVLSSVSESIHIHNRSVILTTIGLTVTIQQNFPEFLSVSRGTLYIENAIFVFDTQAREKLSYNAIRCTNGRIVLFDASFCGDRSMTFVDADSSSIYMRGLKIEGFQNGIIGNSTLMLDSSSLRVSEKGVSFTEGEVYIVNVVLLGPYDDNGIVGIAYSGVHGELNVECCFVTRFSTGIETQGTALIRNVVIMQCHDYGIAAWNDTEPYLCEVEDCKINRCDIGVYAKSMFVVITDSIIRYASLGVSADAIFLTRLETTVIHACDTIIHCSNAQVLKVLGCCLYDCRTVFDINMLDCFSVCDCRVLYFRRTAFLMANFVEQFGFQDNAFCINGDNAEFEQMSVEFHINETETGGNILYTRKNVAHSLLMNGDYNIIPKTILVSPIRREKADT